MKTIICSNGVRLTYDETLKCGDIITAYHKGIHQITSIQSRDGQAPLFNYRTIMTDSFKKTNKKTIKTCDASYCGRVDVMQLKETIKMLEDLIVMVDNNMNK